MPRLNKPRDPDECNGVISSVQKRRISDGHVTDGTNHSPQLDKRNHTVPDKHSLTRLNSCEDQVRTVESNNEVAELRNLFLPVLYLMGFLGLFHPSKGATSHNMPQEHRFSLCSRWAMIISSICIMGYMFGNFVALIVANPGINMNSSIKNAYVIVLTWISYSFLLAVLHFIICELPDRFDRIWELWVHWTRIPHCRNWPRMRLIRNLLIICALFATISPAAIIAVVMSRAQPGVGFELLLKNIEYGSVAINHVWLTINFSLIAFLVFGTAAFTTVFFITHCLVIAEELKFLYQVIAETLAHGRIWDTVMDGGEQVSVLEQLRRRRLECRHLVDALDKTFEQTAFLSLFANVPLIVFIAYGLLSYAEWSDFKKAIGCIGILGSLIQVSAITVAAAWIHEWGAAPKKIIHTLKIHNYLKISPENQASLSLFLSEVASESIGISAWAFAIITKEFVATVIGLAVSYIIVLVEFRHMNEVLDVAREIKEHYEKAQERLNESIFA